MSRIVPAPDALVGKRFDVAVAKMLGISRSKAADLVDSGQARVLGREVARSSTLQAGETVEFDLAEEQSEPEPIATDMAVVYEDDDVVVVDKPVGVAAHASVGPVQPCSDHCVTAACISLPMVRPGVRALFLALM